MCLCSLWDCSNSNFLLQVQQAAGQTLDKLSEGALRSSKLSTPWCLVAAWSLAGAHANTLPPLLAHDASRDIECACGMQTQIKKTQILCCKCSKPLAKQTSFLRGRSGSFGLGASPLPDLLLALMPLPSRCFCLMVFLISLNVHAISQNQILSCKHSKPLIICLASCLRGLQNFLASVPSRCLVTCWRLCHSPPNASAS